MTEFGIKVKFDLDNKQARQLKETTRVQKELSDSYNSLGKSMKTVGAGAAAGMALSFTKMQGSSISFVGSMVEVSKSAGKLESILKSTNKSVINMKTQIGAARNQTAEVVKVLKEELNVQKKITDEIEKQAKAEEKKKKKGSPLELFKQMQESFGGAKQTALTRMFGVFTTSKGKRRKNPEALPQGRGLGTRDALGGFAGLLGQISMLPKVAGLAAKGLAPLMKGLLKSKAAAFGLLGGLIAIGSFSPLLQAEMAFTGVFMEQFSMIIGDAVAPVINILNDALKGLLDLYNSLSPELKATIATLITLTTVLATAAVVVWALSFAVSALSLPIVGVVAAIILLVAVFEHNLFGIKDLTLGVLGSVLDSFTMIFDGLGKLFSGDLSGIIDIWNGFVDLFLDSLFGIPGIVAGVIVNILGAFADLLGIRSLFDDIMGIINNLVGGAMDVITGILTLNLGLIEQGINKIMNPGQKSGGTGAEPLTDRNKLRSGGVYAGSPTSTDGLSDSYDSAFNTPAPTTNNSTTSNTTIIINAEGTGFTQEETDEFADDVLTSFKSKGIIN